MGIKEKIINAIDQNRDEIINCGRYILNNPEMGYKEFKTTKYLAEKYKELLSRYEQLILDNEANPTAEQRLNDLKAEVQQKEAELIMAKENNESVNAELQRVNSELHNESVKVQQLTDELRQAKEALSQSDSVNNVSEDVIAKNAQIEQLQNELVAAKSELKRDNLHFRR